MKKVTVEIKSKGKVLGKAEAPQFDNCADALKNITDEKATALINRMIKIDVSNKNRADLTAKTPSLEKQIAKSFKEMSPEGKKKALAKFAEAGIKIDLAE